MTWLEIQPTDVWLFRDGKPFAAGEDHLARSMFPPTPLTVQGALRQKISVSKGVSLKQYKAASKGKASTDDAKEVVGYIGEHGAMQNPGLFSMEGPFISLRTDQGIVPLLPCPADLFKHSETNDFGITAPDTTPHHNDLGRQYSLLGVSKDWENLPDHQMTTDLFIDYLSGIVPHSSLFCRFKNRDDDEKNKKYTAEKFFRDGYRIWHQSLIYLSENRSGVSTNSLTSFREEGQLYQVQFVRPTEGIGLAVQINDKIPSDLLEGAMTIGGEQRQAVATVIDNFAIPFPPKTLPKKFKVITLTPAYFNGGWEPENGNWSAIFGAPVSLKSAALYRPLKIGGWSNAGNHARHMHNYVKPGSVYYFEAGDEISAPTVFTQNPLEIDAGRFGFGQYAISQW